MHLHHHMQYPPEGLPSFFSLPPSSAHSLPAKDPDVHSDMPLSLFLTKKLRWMTLGGQYDWTAKKYPPGPPPPFPADVAALVEGLFPTTKAQAAIVNLYSPGDMLRLHRDVSEESDAGLVSISLGCDAIFVIGNAADAKHKDEKGHKGDGCRSAAVRLRSGDAVFMAGESRFAWHGVPQVIAGTCPDYLRDWPAESRGGEGGKYDHWRGWMERKRVNLNVRQMG